jgi:CSLREA domain-containing protein
MRINMKTWKLLFVGIMVLVLISGTFNVLIMTLAPVNGFGFRTLNSVLGVMPVSAAVIVVNSDFDSIADDGLCTLREAIVAANTDAAYSDCAAGSGADLITFAGDYTITLNGSRLPLITSLMTITGNGAANTIIQASTCNPVTLPGECTPADNGVFEVENNGNLTLEGITMRHGQGGIAGGGISNRGTLTIQDSILSGNKAISFGGALFNTSNSAVSIQNSAVIGNAAGYGGGIYNGEGSTLAVNNSTIANNINALRGGGIDNYGATVTVTQSTLTANSALEGGGISNYEGSVTVTNSTLSANSAQESGGISNWDGSVTVTNSTLSGNIGGGIYNGPDTVFLFQNSIIAHSTNGADCDSNGTIHGDSTYNLVGDGSCFVTSNLSGDPMLGPLADNGGPTLTHALLLSSPAIDAGNNAVCPGEDQRGLNRPYDWKGSGVAVCDIGAFEIRSASFFLPLIMR